MASPDGFFLLDEKGKLLTVNPAGLALLAVESLAAVVGESFCGFLAASSQPRFPPLLTRLEAGGAAVIELEILRRHDSPCFVEMNLTALQDALGKITALFGVARDITVRRTQELELRAVESYHRQLFANNARPMWFYDTETLALLEVNAAAVAMYGYSREEFLRLTLRDISAPENVPNLLKNVTLDAATRATPRIYQHRKHNGQIIEVELFSHDLTYAGRPARLVSTRDVTAQKQAEALWHESQERMQSILTEIHDVVWSVSLDGKQLLYQNPAAERVYGRAVEEFYANPDLWHEVIYPADRSKVEQVFEIIFAAGYFEAEYRIVRPDGEIRWLQDRSRLITDSMGTPLRIDGIATDITERKRAEERLVEQATMLDQAQEAVISEDLEGRIWYWNRGAELLYGWTADEVLGRNIQSEITPDYSYWLQEQTRLLQEGRWQGELRQCAKDGREFIIEGNWTIVYDEAGQPKGRLGVNRDITEKKMFEAQFLRAQRLESIGALASGVAHDLNNVLSPLAISVYLLRSRLREPSGTEILDTMDELIERGANMVKQVLSFARGSSGERVVLNPKHVLREIAAILKETLPNSIVLKYSAATDLHQIFGDPTQLHQAVMNLCVNARDAMPAGGVLTLSAENHVVDNLHAGMTPEITPGEYVVITVSDTGEGIPSAIRSKIFEPFFTTKEPGRGTGLGLSTALGIVQRKGGSITLYSEVGYGTQFKIYLPIYVAASSASMVAIEATPLPTGQGELILVVDDELALGSLVRETLEMFGYRVMTAVNGEEALVVAAQFEVAVVLVDMMMPGMDGPTVMQSLQAGFPSLRFIASSALTANAKLEDAKQLGVQHFLLKPYTAEILLQTIAEVLQAERQ